MIRIGIIGFGFMGGMHAQAYRSIPGVEVTAIADLAVEATQQKLKQLGIQAPVYADLETLLQECDVDVIDICGPTDQHVALALCAAQAGKHLFIEKPLALTYTECLKISEGVQHAGVTTQVGHCIRFWPEYIKLKDMVTEGSFGALKSLSFSRRAPRPGGSQPDNWVSQVKRCGGAVCDLHVHDTDFIHYLLGTPRSVYSRITHGLSGPDHVFTHYHYDSVAVQAEGGWDYPSNYGFRMSYEAIFEKGCLHFDSAADQPILWIGRNTAPHPVELGTSAAPLESAHGDGNISSLGGYFNELEYFTDCLKKGCPPQIATIAQSTETIRILEAELKSAQIGQSVYIRSHKNKL